MVTSYDVIKGVDTRGVRIIYVCDEYIPRIHKVPRSSHDIFYFICLLRTSIRVRSCMDEN